MSSFTASLVALYLPPSAIHPFCSRVPQFDLYSLAPPVSASFLKFPKTENLIAKINQSLLGKIIPTKPYCQPATHTDG